MPTTKTTRGKGWKTLSVRLTRDEAREFAKIAKSRGKTTKALLRELVRNAGSESERAKWRIR